MDNLMLVCYVRRAGRPWEPAPRPYAHLLELYEDLRSTSRYRQRDPIMLCTTTEDGSILMAHIQPKPHMAGVYLCRVDGANGANGANGTQEEVMELMRGPRALGGR
jgi:hypothetical protein